MGNRTFNIRMFTESDRMRPTAVNAASAHQALMIAMSDPQNNHYNKFGLVGEDDNCHMWQFRPGTPRRRPRGLGIMAASLQEARGRSAPVVVTKQPEPAQPTGPVIISYSPKELTDVVMKNVLPQISPKQAFKTEDIGRLLPVQYATSWTRSQNVRSAVLVRLRDLGVITKYSHFEYMRAPEFVDKKLIEDVPAPAPKVKNGHPPETAVITPPPVTPAAPEPVFSPEEKVDAVLLMIRALMSADQQKKAKLDALADRLIEVTTVIDSIRGELDSLIKGEQQAPMRFRELLDSMRKGSPMSPPPPGASTMASAVLS